MPRGRLLGTDRALGDDRGPAHPARHCQTDLRRSSGWTMTFAVTRWDAVRGSWCSGREGSAYAPAGHAGRESHVGARA